MIHQQRPSGVFAGRGALLLRLISSDAIRDYYWTRCVSSSDVLIVPKRRTRRMTERISSRYPRACADGLSLRKPLVPGSLR